MSTAHNPCDSHCIPPLTKDRNILHHSINILKKLWKSENKKKIMSFKDMHYLPAHIKKDIGFWCVQPKDRPTLPPN